ncbi:GNAT family N-acetyltransferase [Streptomyces sp. NPDC058861]|uniref:GNAT family N-acetyltransferase n=1 Tax=Streptomyces sp. NPDC058861 TaxID=3346653 RepID=UPI00369069BF
MTESDPTLWIASPSCALGPYRADLVETYWRWEQDPTVMVGYGRQVPVSLESRKEGMGHQLLGSNIRFTVYDMAHDKAVPVGVTTLLPDDSTRTAEFVIMLSKEARGRGLGTEATRLTLDYAFHVSALRMVWLKVLAPNTGGIRAYERAGFKHAGRLRQSGYWFKEVCDEVLMDALAEDFSGSSAVKALFPDR